MMRKVKSGGRNGLLPNSLRIISSCLKTVSNNAGSVASTVRSAGASVSASISNSAEDEKDKVLWAGFDKLELGPNSFKNVLLIGYSNGFHVLDVEDASNVWELVSKRDGPVNFLQMQPIPEKRVGCEGFKASHPLLLLVAGDETNGSGMIQGGRLSALIRENSNEFQAGICVPTVVRFYSLKFHNYVHVLRFRSVVYMVRCCPRIVAVALAAQIYCFDAVTLESKFSVLTYPLQGTLGVNIGYGPMAIGPRWLVYASNSPLLSNTGRVSPQNLTPSPGVSPSTSPGNGNLVARYAMESGKHLAAGILNFGDMSYKTISKYCHEFLPDGSSSPQSTVSSRKFGRLSPTVHSCDADNAGTVVVKDFISKDVISQFKAHNSPISALCFDPSGTLLVTASVNGHNINVFRIMPTFIPNGTNQSSYDWSASHVHLYKLYRGITTAVIQDICFSNYSQWIAVVSSRGTCHIYVLSPFGGEATLQPRNSHSDGPLLVPDLTSPWWTTSSSSVYEQCLPPEPVTLSVVSRIKNNSTGWLKTVSSVSSSASGKLHVPSGAIASVFHNSISCYGFPLNLKSDSLEHLLVYSPSGYLILHKLVPSSGHDSCDRSLRTGVVPMQVQDDELNVNAEPVQWWDVCRKSNSPEREENISQIQDKQFSSEMIMDASNHDECGTPHSVSSNGSISDKESARNHYRSHWYLSNAEVQINAGKIPLWQKAKIFFYVMNPSTMDSDTTSSHASGELEIERLPFHEVEIKKRDLLPKSEQFPRVLIPDWHGSVLSSRSHSSSSGALQAPEKSCDGSAAISPSLKDGSVSLQPSSVQSSDLTTNIEIPAKGILAISQVNGALLLQKKNDVEEFTPFHYENHHRVSSIFNSSPSGLFNSIERSSSSSFVGLPEILKTHSSNDMNNEITNPCVSANLYSENDEIGVSNNLVELTNGYVNVSGRATDAAAAAIAREKPEKCENDMSGGLFVFSEEVGA